MESKKIQGGVNSVGVGLMGVVVGVVGAGTAIALSDKKTRNKVGKTVDDITHQASKAIEDVQRKLTHSKNGMKTIATVKKAIKKRIPSKSKIVHEAKQLKSSHATQ